MKDELRKVLEELQRIEAGESVNEDLLEVITLLAETMSGMKEETEWKKD